MVGSTVHISQLKPGVLVLDALRYRKTTLEVLSLPQETLPAFTWWNDNNDNTAITSSWLVQMRDLRSHRTETVRIDCDIAGYTERFWLVPQDASTDVISRRELAPTALLNL